MYLLIIGTMCSAPICPWGRVHSKVLHPLKPVPLSFLQWTFSFLLIPVPSAPENLNVTNVLANQFTLEWDPPFLPNGIIQFYAVFVQGLDTLNQVSASFFQVQQFLTLDLSLNISAMPYSFYAVDIGAVTNAGLGNLSSASVLTPEAREFVCITTLTLLLLALWLYTSSIPT